MKAKEFLEIAKRYKLDRPTIGFPFIKSDPTDQEKLTADITDSGHLQINAIGDLDAGEARKFAKWILDIYS